MLEIVGTATLAGVSALIFYILLNSLMLSAAARGTIALALGSWVGLVVVAGSAGLLATSRPFPLIGLFISAPLIAAASTAIVSPSFRAALLAISERTIVALNIGRVFGAFFLLLAAQGLLAGPFPQSAGWSDVITGVAAFTLVISPALLANRSVLFVWNAFGAADLIAALTLGVMSADGSPLQMIHAGVGSRAVQFMPWALIPTVLVPTYLVLHAIIFVKLYAGSNSSISPAR